MKDWMNHTGHLKNFRKLLNFAFGSHKDAKWSLGDCGLNFASNGISPHALERAKFIRKIDREPAIIIHGVMPRSGTVYVGSLLALHPDVYAYPSNIWEIPFLKCLTNIIDFQESFFRSYPQNTSKIGGNDFLPLFGAAFIDYLYSLVPEGKRMLLKAPNVQHLNYFFTVFPHESLLLLMRDGRDLVESTIRTWSSSKFPEVCRQWHDGTKMALAFDAHHREQNHRYLTAKYEEIVKDPVSFVKKICSHFNLNETKFPFSKVKDIPVYGSSSLKKYGQVHWDPVAKPEGFTTIGHWKKWDFCKKQTFKKIAGQTLVETGYCENLSW